MKKSWIVGALLVMGAGCGGSSSSTEAWTGSWVSAVTESETCSDGNHSTSLDGAFQIASGGGDKIITMSANGCDLTWNVSGSEATLEANQKCSVPSSVAGTWNPTFASGTLTLSGNVIMVGDEGNGNNGDGTTTVTCTFTQSGTFTKS